MSADGSTTFVWGGDERTFRLGIGELLALQERRNSGPQEILNRFRYGKWWIEDMQEIMRLGVIGEMMRAPNADAVAIGKKARDLVEANIRPGNITDNAAPALKVLLAALQGDPDDPVGKNQATTEVPEAPASPPPPSTEAAR